VGREWSDLDVVNLKCVVHKKRGTEVPRGC
jgi:hypothetical protein